MSKYFSQGYAANEKGAQKNQNPYKIDSPQYRQWADGWEEGEASYQRSRKAETGDNWVGLVLVVIIFAGVVTGLAEFVKFVWELLAK